MGGWGSVLVLPGSGPGTVPPRGGRAGLPASAQVQFMKRMLGGSNVAVFVFTVYILLSHASCHMTFTTCRGEKPGGYCYS